MPWISDILTIIIGILSLSAAVSRSIHVTMISSVVCVLGLAAALSRIVEVIPDGGGVDMLIPASAAVFLGSLFSAHIYWLLREEREKEAAREKTDPLDRDIATVIPRLREPR
ncbi:hypothetical protein [Candidatus Darwinibacter acetoxidans]